MQHSDDKERDKPATPTRGRARMGRGGLVGVSHPLHGRVQGRGAPSLGRMFEGGGLPLPSWGEHERGGPAPLS